MAIPAIAPCGKSGAATAANGYRFAKSQGKPNTLIRQ
jgi:hypothetical protein